MYSIVETGGFQYKVQAGQTVRLPLMDAKVGSEVELKSVLLTSSDAGVQVGTPVLADALVKLEILSHGKSDKVLVFKKKRRTRYEKTKGHRQDFTEVLVIEVASGSEKSTVDAVFRTRVRARVAALLKQRTPAVKITRREKIAQGIPKPAKVTKNSLRKES